jgi:hypothetical protein
MPHGLPTLYPSIRTYETTMQNPTQVSQAPHVSLPILLVRLLTSALQEHTPTMEMSK